MDQIVKNAQISANSVFAELKTAIEAKHQHSLEFQYSNRVDNVRAHNYEPLIDAATFKFEAKLNEINQAWVGVITTLKADAHIRLINLGVFVEEEIK